MNNPKSFFIAVAVIAAFITLIIINGLISSEADKISYIEEKQEIIKEVENIKIIEKKPVRKGVMAHILRIERQKPPNKFKENTIIKDKEVIATYNEKNGKIFNQTGSIPDGKIKFVDENQRTYGFEEYYNEKRHGSFVEYYGEGLIKTEAEYRSGELMQRKTYFSNGNVRSEENYEVAGTLRDFIEISDFNEAGEGKIYRANGKVRYEWSVVEGAQEHFAKTYDRHGELIEAKYFNESGDLIKHWKRPKEMVVSSQPIENKEVMDQERPAQNAAESEKSE